jgi:hypothetical protein
MPADLGLTPEGPVKRQNPIALTGRLPAQVLETGSKGSRLIHSAASVSEMAFPSSERA